jgi:hypothetical protein
MPATWPGARTAIDPAMKPLPGPVICRAELTLLSIVPLEVHYCIQLFV